MGSLQNAVGAEPSTAASGRESPPTSFSQLGIPTGPDLRNTALFGPIKPLSAVSRLEWAFFTISSLSLIVSLGFTVERLISLKKDTDDYTFAIMLCFTSLFCFFYIVHGILKERYHEIAVFIFSSILLLVYLILNVVSPSQTAEASIQKKVRLGVAVFFLLGIIYLGGKVAHGYWSERRLLFRINAKEDLQGMLGWLFLCSSLIFFDVQLQGTMLIFVMNHGTHLSHIEIIVLAVGPVVTLLGAIAGECTIRKESKVWLSIFVVLWFPNVVYIGLKLYDLKPSESWTVLYKATVACAVVALLIRLALAFTMYKVVRNFGRGLREKLSAGESLESLRPSTYYRYSAPDVGVAHSPGSGSHWDQSGRVN
uniref:Conserved plasma membrane protein n=1 Tax=Rhipicephalus zambeziensis TaxID=60191 RepID=A0A224YK56_9ACAR